MLGHSANGGGLRAFPDICVPTETIIENIRSSTARPGLNSFGRFKPHDRTIGIAAGGPSLADTYQDIRGDIAAVNGSLRFLLERGITPWGCGILDPRPRLADVIDAHPDVIYFVSSTCAPEVFDKLKNCTVVLWHPSPWPDGLPVPDLLIGGGTTIGLRWMTMAYTMGYRRFDLHGLDSSYRGKASHAYPDGFDRTVIEVDGYTTEPNFVVQVQDFMAMMEAFKGEDIEPISVRVNGDGLLQSKWNEVLDASRGLVEAAERTEPYHAGR